MREKGVRFVGEKDRRFDKNEAKMRVNMEACERKIKRAMKRKNKEGKLYAQ